MKLLPGSSIQVHLSASQASLNPSTTTPTWLLEHGVSGWYKTQLMLSVIQVAIPLSGYVIRSTNNSLVLNSTTFVIPSGNWAATDLATRLTSLLTSESITVTYSRTTNKFTFTSESGEFDIGEASTCLSLLGFSAQTHSSEELTLVSDGVVNLSGTSCIYIESNFPTQNLYNETQSNILVKVPVTSNYSSIIVWQNPAPVKVWLKDDAVNRIELTLLDNAGEILDLNGLDWSITLQIDAQYPPGFDPATFFQSLLSEPNPTETVQQGKK
jgi:hypothetical protein